MKFLTSIGLVAFLIPSGGVSQAAPVTLEFTGTIAQFIQDDGGYLDGSIRPYGDFWGTYTFESTTADDFPNDPQRGRYTFIASPELVITLHIGDYSLVAPLGYINVQPADSYSVASNPFSFGDIAASVSFTLVDPWGISLTDDALPLTPLEMSSSSKVAFSFSSVDLPGFVVNGEITSITPEPHSAACLLIGSLVACMRRRK